MFKELNVCFIFSCILDYLDWDKEFHMHAYTSNLSIGATLA